MKRLYLAVCLKDPNTEEKGKWRLAALESGYDIKVQLEELFGPEKIYRVFWFETKKEVEAFVSANN